MDSKFEIDTTKKIIKINPTPKGVTIYELYSYMKNVWEKEELRENRKKKLERLKWK